MRRLALLLLVIGLCALAAAPPLPLRAQTTPNPFGPSPLEPPTLAATPTATVTATWTPSPTPTWTPEPTATATTTIAPYQVSPLTAQGGGPPEDATPLWIGAAALLVLGGSAVLLLAERRR